MPQITQKTRTNVMVVLFAAVGFAAAFGIGIWALNKSQTFKPGLKPVPDLKPPGYYIPGYETPGYQPPGYTVPGYEVPGYNIPGYTVPGYTPPGYAAPGYLIPGTFIPQVEIPLPQVKYKSEPVVNVPLMSNETLRNGEMEIYRMTIGAKPQGSIALKQMAFAIERSSEVIVKSLKLYRGDMQLPSDQYFITDAATNRDVKTYELPRGEMRIVVVTFASEASISGSGQVFSLHATIGLLGKKGVLSAKPYRGSTEIVKGYLANTAVEPFPVVSSKIFNIDTNETWDGRADLPGYFVWSDLSELPHTDVSTRAFNSRDWFNDYLTDALETQFTFKQRNEPTNQ